MGWTAWRGEVGTTVPSLEVLKPGPWEEVTPGDLVSLSSHSL